MSSGLSPHMCRSRKLVRGGPTLTFFIVDNGRDDPHNTKIRAMNGPPAIRHLMLMMAQQ